MNLRCMSYAKVPLNSDKYSLFHMVGTRRHQLPDTYLMLFPSVLTFSCGWQTGNFTFFLKEKWIGEVIGPIRPIDFLLGHGTF